MTARAASFPPVDDPVLRAIARAPMGEPETPEERAIVDAAKAEVAGGEPMLTHEQLVASLRAHAAGREP